MPVDRQVRMILDLLDGVEVPAFTGLTAPQARAMFDAMPPAALGADVASVAEHIVAGPAHDVPVRVYTPITEEARPLPLLVWFHGGGWVLGTLEGSDPTARSLAAGADAVCVSVDYRLAPEHPFPAAPEDCFAALQWAVEHAEELGADASRVAVGGDSAGGNLAAVVCLMARARGGPALCHQLLIYPVTDFDDATGSMVDNAEGYLLTRAVMRWFYDHYTTPGQRTDPLAAPLRADDLSGLPPALVITAEYDPLRDEGDAYARRLQDAGVPTVLSRYDGMIHGFFGMTAVIDRAREAQTEVVEALQKAFSR